jgi:hypothetical protein
MRGESAKHVVIGVLHVARRPLRTKRVMESGRCSG